MEQNYVYSKRMSVYNLLLRQPAVSGLACEAQNSPALLVAIRMSKTIHGNTARWLYLFLCTLVDRRTQVMAQNHIARALAFHLVPHDVALRSLLVTLMHEGLHYWRIHRLSAYLTSI